MQHYEWSHFTYCTLYFDINWYEIDTFKLNGSTREQTQIHIVYVCKFMGHKRYSTCCLLSREGKWGYFSFIGHGCTAKSTPSLWPVHPFPAQSQGLALKHIHMSTHTGKYIHSSTTELFVVNTKKETEPRTEKWNYIRTFEFTHKIFLLVVAHKAVFVFVLALFSLDVKRLLIRAGDGVRRSSPKDL